MSSGLRTPQMPRWKQLLLLRLLNDYRTALAAENKTHAEDAVVDVMDMVAGWISPHMRLDNGGWWPR